MLGLPGHVRTDPQVGPQVATRSEWMVRVVFESSVIRGGGWLQ